MSKLKNNLIPILVIGLIAALLASTVFFCIRSQDVDCKITIGSFHRNSQGNTSIDLSQSDPLSSADMATVLNALFSAQEAEAPVIAAEDPSAVMFIDFPPKPEFGTKFVYVWITEDEILLGGNPDDPNITCHTVKDTYGNFREILTKALESNNNS